jgi:hypothetical protein
MLVRPDDRGIDGMLLGPRLARISNAASHTPILLQRVKRTKTEFQLPYRSGMSRQGAPVRRTQRMPLTIRRLSEIGGPRSPRSGSKGLRMCHSESVRSPRLNAASPRKAALNQNPIPLSKTEQRGLIFVAAQLTDDFNLSRPFSRLTPESANELGQPAFGAWFGLLFRQTARGRVRYCDRKACSARLPETNETIQV